MIKSAVKENCHMVKEVRTVNDSGGTPLLEIVKEDDMVVIYEADDMDRQIQFPASTIPALIDQLHSLK
jgi:uncharacterized protein with GYD domain